MNKKSKSSKAMLQPRIILDSDVLASVNEYYSSYLGDAFIGLECFSHPSMERHCCNALASVEGGEGCSHCSNILGRPCPITCDIHRFCLAAYAARLGVGVTSRTKGMKSALNNLNKLEYKELHKLVMERHEPVAGHLEVISTEGQPRDKAQLDLVLGEPTPVTQAAKRLKKVTHGNDGEDLMTIYSAATLYGCDHATMYNMVNRGKLDRVAYAGAVFVRTADVLKLKESKEGKDD